MSTSTPQPAPRIQPRGASRFVRGSRALWAWWGRRRLLVRLGLIALAVLASGAFGLFLFWAIGLAGLPDVGDPFDVQAFRESMVKSARDAAAQARTLATTRMPPIEPSDKASRQAMRTYAWIQATPKLHAWVVANRRVLEPFLQTVERAAATASPAETRTYPPPNLNWGMLFDATRVALFEASRLESEGDLAGAWRLYRACLRAERLAASRAEHNVRLWIASQFGAPTVAAVGHWADHPQNNAKLLRAALDDALALDQIAISDEYSLQFDYVQALHALESDGRRQAGIHLLLTQIVGVRNVQYIPDQTANRLDRFLRVLYHEPERSRRLARLVYAQRLAVASQPFGKRPTPAESVSLGFTGALPVELYDLGPDAHADARALPAAKLARWLRTSPSALVSIYNRPYVDARRLEYTNLREVKSSLAYRLYILEHGGKKPASDADLVGPYLPAPLPLDFAEAETGVEVTPAVETELMPQSSSGQP